MITNFKQVFSNLKEEGPAFQLLISTIRVKAQEFLKVVLPALRLACPRKVEEPLPHQLDALAEGKVFNTVLLPSPTNYASEGSGAIPHPS